MSENHLDMKRTKCLKKCSGVIVSSYQEDNGFQENLLKYLKVRASNLSEDLKGNRPNLTS